MIAFRLSRPKAVQDEPEAPAPELDVRDCLPGHLHAFQLSGVLSIEMRSQIKNVSGPLHKVIDFSS